MPSDLENESSREAREPWYEYRRLVLSEFERLNHSIADLNTKIDSGVLSRVTSIELQVAILQTKMIVYSSIVGVVTSGAVAIIVHFIQGGTK